MKRRIVILIITIIMLGGASFMQSADAHERGTRHGGRDGKSIGKLHGMKLHGGYSMWRLNDLNLDEQQKAGVKQIRDRVTKETVRKKADARIADIELRDLLYNDTVDMNAVQAKLKQTESLRTEIRLSHIRAREEIKSILTPEQLKRFNETLDLRPVGKRVK